MGQWNLPVGLVGVVVEFGVEICSVLSSPGSSWCLFPS